MRSSDKNVFQSDNNDSRGKSFVVMLQLYTNKTVTYLKANAIVAYPIHAVFQSFKKQFRRYPIDQEHALVGLLLISSLEHLSDREVAYESVNVEKLPNSSQVSLQDELPVSTLKDFMSSKLRVRHKPMHKCLAPPAIASACIFFVILSRTHWKCHPTAVSYCCDTSKVKDMSNVKHGGTAFPCIRA